MSKKHKKKPLLKRSKFRKYRKTVLWVSFLVVILYATSFWSNHQSMKISSIEIVGNRFVESSTVEKVFFEEISGRHFFLVSKSHFLFIPKGIISKKIENKLSVDSVSIRRSDINNAVIEIVEHKPIAEYCTTESADTISDCYFVNSEGLIFVKASKFYTDVLISLEGDIEKGEDESVLGKNFSEIETFKKLFKKIELLEMEGIEINKISTEDFETYVLHTIGGPTLLVEETDIPRETIENLKAAIAQESINDIQFNNIDYIDLRFEDKVFYKLK